MKRVGIITYHKHNNYGTMLQAYALQKTVDDMGYDAEIINFRQDTSVRGCKLLLLRLKRVGVYIKEFKKYKTLSQNIGNIELKNNEFERFYKDNIKVKGEMFTNTEMICANPPQYDGYIVGSDQTWNPYASEGPKAFFLPFVKESRKKGSYAPSVAVTSLTEKQKVEYKELLSDFAFLSCREKSGAKLIENVLGRKVEVVLDPTFLLDKSKWSEVAEDVDNEDYILTYFLGEKKEHRQYVKELSKRLGLKILSIPASYIEMADKDVHKVWCGPEKFLGLLKNAEIVCTDSFHGMALSINMGKDFYSFCKTANSEKESENSRILNVLEMFGLGDRLVNLDDCVPEMIESIDYEKVDTILEKRRNDSISYLENMLSEITK